MIDAPRVTRLPGAPAGVLGVANVRGEVIPVFDTAAVLGVAGGGRASYAAVVDTAAGPIALAADSVPRSEPLGDDLGPAELEAATGRRAVRDGVAAVLDPDLLRLAAHEGR